ncbi:alpha/beta fold hydrolase [Candidatus Poriferisodalis sp.]|uniref:alpha/beta fold hydrolase n=1 Tax=Candidatus Poriferisodalis sp. TaxID=3101277 RepID=UPI003B5274A9
MTLVLVHGNPETTAIWDRMRVALARHGVGPDNVVALSPPGFGVPAPDSFGATMNEYRDWLVTELEQLQAGGAGPIDLLGHDWGGGHVMRIAMERPDLIRSWCTDVIGLFDPDYEWHGAAQVWQSPRGEASIARTTGRPDDESVAFYAGLGMGPDVAAAVVPHINADMGRCILALYRDASQPAMSGLGFNIAAAGQRPGLCILAAGDHFTGGGVMHRRVAKRAGARVTELLDVGHWWMCENPGFAAHTVASWMTSLDRASTAPSGT